MANQHETSGVILAVNHAGNQKQGPLGELNAIAEGMYVFPAKPDAANPLASEVAEITKSLSVNLATQFHPQLGTGVRVGWVVVGAISLLSRARSGQLAWHEVALKGGQLSVEAYFAANSALPEALQGNTDWCEGTTCLIEAAGGIADGDDAHPFVVGNALDQSPPVEQMRKLLSLAVAAQHPDSKFSFVSANPIDVTVQARFGTASARVGL